MALPAIFGASTVAQIAAWFIGKLVASLIFRIGATLGLAFVAYEATDYVGQWLHTQVMSTLHGIPAGMVYDLLAACGFFTAANIIMSAYVSGLSILAVVKVGKRLVFGVAD